jgi:hypothetical protein
MMRNIWLSPNRCISNDNTGRVFPDQASRFAGSIGAK